VKARFAAWQEAHQDVVALDLLVRIHRRDQEAAGSVVGSALAFRLFLFFVPLLLLLVGAAGFLSGHVSTSDVTDEAGVSGEVAVQVRNALTQPNSTRWVAVSFGLVGVVTAGRSLSKALWSASTQAWRLPVRSRASLRVVGSVAGLVCAMGLIAVLVNRIRDDLGLAVAGFSFIGALAAYFVAWMVISVLLPRPTTDPGALLPGAALVALVFTALHAVSELYLPNHLSRASELYGAIGTTIVTLGWFFFLGRAIALAMILNAVLYERVGSVSTLAFSLPVIRILPRKFPRLRRFFELDEGSVKPAGPD
jgi:uncharacterized BrkB/YihY/UPF0761 family membrane protein